MIPSPYLALAGLLALLGAFVGGDLYRGRQDKITYDGAIAGLQRDAAATLAAANARAAAQDQANAETARNLEERHAHELEMVNAARGDAAQRLTVSLRKLAQCGSGGPGPVPAPAPGASVPAGGSPGGDGGLPDRAGERLAELGTGANKLAATVRGCVEWARSVGR